MKKAVKLSIDESLLDKAKKNIPNLSRFVEECLEYKLNIVDYYSNPEAETKLRQINNDIDNLVFERNLLIKLVANQDLRESRENHKKMFVWRKLFHNFLKYKNYDYKDLEEACEVLERDKNDLINMLEQLYEHCLYSPINEKNNIKNNYTYAVKTYLEL